MSRGAVARRVRLAAPKAGSCRRTTASCASSNMPVTVADLSGWRVESTMSVKSTVAGAGSWAHVGCSPVRSSAITRKERRQSGSHEVVRRCGPAAQRTSRPVCDGRRPWPARAGEGVIGGMEDGVGARTVGTAPPRPFRPAEHHEAAVPGLAPGVSSRAQRRPDLLVPRHVRIPGHAAFSRCPTRRPIAAAICSAAGPSVRSAIGSA